MVTLWAYTGLILLTVFERLAELVISRRNARRAFERGGREFGRDHFPWMVALHTLFLVGCVAEPWLLDRPFIPALGLAMLALAMLSQAIRWWVISTLGERWNTRVIVVPGMKLAKDGPYRWFRHPNYVAVVIEGFALPLIHSAWITALAFTVLNALVLTVRIRCENDALKTAEAT